MRAVWILAAVVATAFVVAVFFPMVEGLETGRDALLGLCLWLVLAAIAAALISKALPRPTRIGG